MHLRKISFLIFSFFIFHFSLLANIRLPKLISDGMVLQRDQKVNVWGWAFANEQILLTIDNKKYKTKADIKGNWKLVLPPHKAGGPYTLHISGLNTIEIKNVVFGDVWLCSGQSNMELPMNRVKILYEYELSTIEYFNIRTFNVPQKYNFKTSESDYQYGKWQQVNPQTILSFSAVAFFFARELYEDYRVPIGIINASLGGSPVQAWMSEEALKGFPDYLNEAYKWRNDELIKQTEKHDTEISNAWYAEANEKDAGHGNPLWSSENINDADWQTIDIPGYWNEKYSEINNGVVWFRREFIVSKEDARKPAFLNLGRIIDADSTFINGKFVGNVTYQYPPRWYNVPENLLKEGRNEIAVRVVSNAGIGGFVLDKNYELKTANNLIYLNGEWKMKQGCSMPVLPGQTFIRWKPMGLYNGMIAPLNSFTKKGILWYQGESNTGKPEEYTALLSTMITDWRSKFNQNKLPFIFAQLPNFMEAKAEPVESNWALFRQAQVKVLAVKNTAMSVNIDLGEWNDIHPLNKKDVGLRLAKIARKLAYGEKIIATAPFVKSAKTIGNKIVITFNRNGKCISTFDGKAPQEFAVAGSDGKFVWATAEISGNQIIIYNSTVTKPVKIRYAWADNPENANLTDTDGNFVSPFQIEVK